MSNIDKQALREAAEKATPGDWKYSTFDCAITDDTSSLAIVRMDSGHLNDEQSALNGAFIAAANPATVLAQLDELEAAEKRNTELVHNHRVHATRLIDERGQLKQRIAELEERGKSLRTVGVMSQKAFQQLEGRESRFIALWPRPEIYLPRKRPEDGVIVYARVAGTAKGE
ncbi:ead/Ea22-like family protein [Enterobacter mori]|uniref:ead/Ea22-like family protein n=1 Tax=Enterobacter mori TaxID=539813 RepID=UPI001BDFBBDF|nr:ead/Ea22-like family protein [Enterobacter mori]MBT1883663.1 ead/Ea22-like family protein [Enterobacter mori]MCW4856757.1 ead/Ea22-like family protein [Enterobacter mori]